MRFLTLLIALTFTQFSYADELPSLQSLGGAVGDTHGALQLKIRFADGVYAWVRSPDVATITPSDAGAIYNIGFLGQAPDSFNKVAESLSPNVSSFSLFQGDMSKPVPPNLLSTPASIFYTQCDFSSPDAALPEIPAGCDSVFVYIRIPQNVGVNTWGAAAPQLNDVGTTWRNGRQFRRLIFERSELTSAHQIALVQSLEREILAGMGADYVSTSDTVRWIDFESSLSGANDPLDVAAMEALGWSVDSATVMSKVIDGDNWRVFHN